jgi:putative heme-binding domain-containing protein
LTLAELAGLLDDPRFAVRDQAVEWLGEAGEKGTEVLRGVVEKGDTIEARRNAIWSLTRIDGQGARAAVRFGLGDPDASVRIAAAHSAGLHRDRGAVPALSRLLVDDSLAVRREAATALGRIRCEAAVPALLDCLRTVVDRFLEHALIYALVEMADPKATRQGLADPDPRVMRGALIALDQMVGGGLARGEVIPLLESDDEQLRSCALSVITAKPDWWDALVSPLRGWLGRPDLAEARAGLVRECLRAFVGRREIQEVVAEGLTQEDLPLAVRHLLLEAIAEGLSNEGSPLLSAPLARQLSHPDLEVRRRALMAIESTGTDGCEGALELLARGATQPAELRLAALRLCAARKPELDDALMHFLVSQLAEEGAPLTRLSAARVAARAALSEAQRANLIPFVAKAGVLELGPLLQAFERPGEETSGLALVEALAQAPALPSLRSDQVKAILKDHSERVREAAEPLLRRLEVGAEDRRARLALFGEVVEGGDPARGAGVFAGEKAACSTCHRVRGEGAQIGPDLSTIGALRSGRDLLESIVFPSATLTRGYEFFKVATRNGQVYNGLVTRETVGTLCLTLPDRSEVRLARASIEMIQPSELSIMPEGLDAQLSREDLRDLVSFLRSLK